MPDYLECGNCGKRYKFPEAMRGRTLRCKGCGQGIAVPTDDEDTEAYDVAPAAKPVSQWAAAIQTGETGEARREGGETRGGNAGRKADSPAAVVDNNLGIAKLEKMYKSGNADVFYAKRRTEMFSRRQVTAHCVCCKTPATEVHAFTWTCPKTEEQETTFTTYHTICPKCQAAEGVRRLVANVVFWTVAIVVMCIAVMIGLSVVDQFATPLKVGDKLVNNPFQRRALAGVVALPFMIFGFYFRTRMDHFKIPGPLRFMTGGRFKWKKTESL